MGTSRVRGGYFLKKMKETGSLRAEGAILVGVGKSAEREALGPLVELRRLVETAGAHVLESVWQSREKLDATYCIGSGKVEEVRVLADRLKANVVIIDHDLTPAQVRNLEEILDRKVLDRSEVILDIFASHARSTQAKLQVELAQLRYQLPRLKHLWTHLERLGGGIGTRGPGEKQLETDRRLASQRIQELQRRLDEIKRRRERQVSDRTGYFSVGLVGYTNAGKSTLLNALTNADAYVADKLFATLDTKTRLWHLAPRMEALVSDTVGFIRKIPTHLIESFNATLAEARHADLLLHVIDVSSPAAMAEAQTVDGVLQQIECAEKPTIAILNKMDRLEDQTALALLRNRYPREVEVSALRGDGLEQLTGTVIEILRERMITARVTVDQSASRTFAELKRAAEVLESRAGESRVELVVRIRPDVLAQLAGSLEGLRVIEPAGFAAKSPRAEE